MKGKDQSMKKILLFLALLVFVTVAGYCENEMFVIKEINLKLVKCPAGSFMMGSQKNELGHGSDEILHKVTLSKPFYIGIYEVTQNQYKAIEKNNPSFFKGDNKPVEQICWDDAKDFCKKLNIRYKNLLPKGYVFDLPTEAQWEYACRAGTTNALNNGKNLTIADGTCPNLDEVAWYSKNSEKSSHIVGQKKPNAWGIYDMHGNVGEWCRDWCMDYTDKELVDPFGITPDSSRVNRGGGWFDIPARCRSAFRCGDEPDIGYKYLGFRVALVPVE